ncbi:hypothetical protein MOQ_003703 [Trypanosoma cruzi marinkellei]|uniref:Transmembrane protein n=1 Tax=Trypanosoma cruzi marinkellei TaxID=85056 RepID=K2NC40_TRYCR|nr:hypothetical protein MOQ_003703 [Trypanosoma cruzi marinkellei]
MKRARSRRGGKADQSVSPPRRRIEANASEGVAKGQSKHRQRDEHTGQLTAPQRESRGFAYMRDASENTSLFMETPGAIEAGPTVPRPPVNGAVPRNADEEGEEFASLFGARSLTRGFSHLRESISFALPRLRGSVHGVSISRGESVLLPLSTPPHESASRSSISSSHSLRVSRGNNQHAQKQQQQQQQQQQRRKYHNHRVNGSDQSFLSTRSAIEYLNSTGSLGGVLSSRESRRSSQATGSHHSLSKSTLGPIDLSPILKVKKRERRRAAPRGGVESNALNGGSNNSGGGGDSPTRRPPPNGLPIEVPAAMMNPADIEVRNSRSLALEVFHHSMARYSRATNVFLITCLFVVVWGMLAAPLLMGQTGPEDAFVRHYVDSVSELQFIYEVPYMSLSFNEARRLYLRVLSETLERLERATSHLRPPDTDVKAQILYHKQMIRAYLALRHRARLYARSRDRSRLNQFVFNPLRDVWYYGILRNGFKMTLYELMLEPSFSLILTRVNDITVCLRQDEKLPCPTLAYLEEREKKQQQWEEVGETPPDILTDTAVKDSSLFHEEKVMEELRRLNRTLNYVKESCRQSNREYNHLYTIDNTQSMLW